MKLVVNATPRPLYFRERAPVHIVELLVGPFITSAEEWFPTYRSLTPRGSQDYSKCPENSLKSTASPAPAACVWFRLSSSVVITAMNRTKSHLQLFLNKTLSNIYNFDQSKHNYFKATEFMCLKQTHVSTWDRSFTCSQQF